MNRCKLINKKNRLLKRVLLFFFFETIFTAIIFPFYIFYGPFTKVRNIIVSTSMATMNHQYIAKSFLSKAKIDEILNLDTKANNATSTVIQQNINNIQTSKDDNSTEVIELKGKKFHGKAIIIHNPFKIKVGYSSQLMAIGGVPIGIAMSNGKLIYPINMLVERSMPTIIYAEK